MSIHEALVFELNFEKLEGSDNLSKTKVEDNIVVCNTAQWAGYTRGAYIDIDTLVDTTRPEFDFLAKDARYNELSVSPGPYARIRARKIRNCQSYGMLVPVPNDYPIGKNCWDELGLAHYDPPPKAPKNGVISGGESAPPPKKHTSLPKYDIEKGKKFARGVFVEGEPLVLTLKYHGMNFSALYSDGEFHCRSHYEFKREFVSPPTVDRQHIIDKLGEEEGNKRCAELEAKFAKFQPSTNTFWKVLRENEELQKFLQDNPDTIVWGEIIGIQGEKFMYGLPQGQVSYRVFDISKDKRWLDYQEARDLSPSLKWVRTIHENLPFNMEKLIELVEHMPTYDNIGRYEEGFVAQTYRERWNQWTGRSKLKMINPVYSEKS
jgi:hypothetical protein